jgi:hypothetical protein
MLTIHRVAILNFSSGTTVELTQVRHVFRVTFLLLVPPVAVLTSAHYKHSCIGL